MSKQIKYQGKDQMPANMFGLPLKAIETAEQNITSEELIRLRHSFAKLYNPPLSFNQTIGEFEYLTDQQSFEIFLSGYTHYGRLAVLLPEETARVTDIVRLAIPKHNVLAIAESDLYMERSRRAGEEARKARLALAVPVVEAAEGSAPSGKAEPVEASASTGTSNMTSEKIDEMFIAGAVPRSEISPVSIVPALPLMDLESSAEIDKYAGRVAFSGYSREVGESSFRKINLEAARTVRDSPAELREQAIRAVIDTSILNPLPDLIGPYSTMTTVHVEDNEGEFKFHTYDVYLHVSGELLEKNLTTNDVTLDVTVQPVEYAAHDLVLTLTDLESGRKIISLVKAIEADSRDTVGKYLLIMLQKYERLKFTTSSDLLAVTMHDVVNRAVKNGEGLSVQALERFRLNRPEQVIPPADSDVVVMATGFPMIRAFELQLRAHGHGMIANEVETELVFLNESDTTVSYKLYAFPNGSREPKALFHGAYQQADFDQLAKELCQVMSWWNTMRVVLTHDGLIGKLRSKVIRRLATLKHELSYINLYPLLEIDEAAEAVETEGNAPIGTHVVLSTYVPDPSSLEANALTGGFAIAAANVITPTLLKDPWVVKRTTKFREDLYDQLLNFGVRRDCVDKYIDSFLNDMDKELSGRLSRH